MARREVYTSVVAQDVLRDKLFGRVDQPLNSERLFEVSIGARFPGECDDILF